MDLSIIILAAGSGKRMHSDLPKVLHPVGGVPMLERVVKTAQALSPTAIYVVHGNGDHGARLKEMMQHLPVKWVLQERPQGTGHAVHQVLKQVGMEGRVLVLYADVPLISQATLTSLLQQTPEDAVGLMVAELNDPTGFGRIIRDRGHHITAIVEHKDANEKELQIREINTGIVTAPAKLLQAWLPQLTNRNAQGEYYLTDIIHMAAKHRVMIKGVTAECADEMRGVNNFLELARVERYYQRNLAEQLLRQGTRIFDPERLDVRGELQVAADVVIDVNVVLEGRISIGARCSIGPNVVLRNVALGNDVVVHANCVVEDAMVADGCQIGPFARLRPGTRLGERVHIGNFVEVKNSHIGEGSKSNHLAYLGDAEVGKYVNIGAGVITCNYDGVSKHVTTIGDGAFIGSDSQLVAPVTVGERAYIGAGSTINKDAPPEQLTLARARQCTIPGWKPPVKKSLLKEE